MTPSKQTVFIFKKMSVENATLAALLNLCAPEVNHLIQTKKFFSLMRNIFEQDEKTDIQNGRQLCSDHEDVPIVMHNENQLKANLMDHWLEEMWPPSSTDCNSLDFFMWCVFEREINKCPYITLTSLKVMTSDVVTELEREVIIHA